MKLNLSSVTLVCVDDIDPHGAKKVLEWCKSMVDFGDVKLLTSLPCDYPSIKIMPLRSLVAYSIFMLTRLHEYIDTPNLLIVQRDGFILNPSSWDNEWLELDYIGGLFIQEDRVGSGGFSLRSKRIMQAVSETIPYWDGTQKGADEIQSSLGFYEDGILSLGDFGRQFKIGSLEQAAKFSQAGNMNLNYYIEKPFGFHRLSQYIDFNTGQVSSSFENYEQNYELEIK